MADAATILQEMLDDVSDDYDKREGSFMYDAQAPVSEKLSVIDDEIDIVKAMMRVSNLSGDELELRINDSTGLSRKKATYSSGVVTVIGTGTISSGDLFETDSGTQFKSTETKVITDSGDVDVIAVLAGNDGNVVPGAITLFPVTLIGFSAVSNEVSTAGGYDEESDEDLLDRYNEKLSTPVTTGNKNQYKVWAKEVTGVGDAKVISLWNGVNTVKVVIIDSNRQEASADVIEAVQDYIDPGSTGLGEGEAPIGSVCTVVSATTVSISISATIVLDTGYSITDVETSVSESIEAYLKDIAFEESIVSFARVGSAILGSEGVYDYSGLLVNSGTSNVSIGDSEVAILGMVTLSE